MKCLIKLGLCTLVLSACEAVRPTDFISNPRAERGPVINKPYDEENPVSPGEELPELPQEQDFYVSAIVNGTEGTKQLALYKNGKRVLALDCSFENRISEEADTHFLLEGELFTTFKAEGKSIIKRNGSDYLEYSPASYVKDMILSDEDLWTLDIPLYESGFCLRKNGEALLSKSDGIPSTLYRDSADICFTYSCQLGDDRVIYLVKNTVETQLEAPYGGVLLDARLYKGKIWYLEKIGEQYRLSCGEEIFPYFLPAGFLYLNSEILPLSDGTCMCVLHTRSAYSQMCVDQICRSDSSFLRGSGVASYYYTSESPERVVNLSKDGQLLYVYSLFNGEEYKMDGPRMMNQKCAAQQGGKMYVGLSFNEEDKAPFIWCEGKRMEYNINGYISAVCFTSPN